MLGAETHLSSVAFAAKLVPIKFEAKKRYAVYANV
jgi:hypothetical protein